MLAQFATPGFAALPRSCRKQTTTEESRPPERDGALNRHSEVDLQRGLQATAWDATEFKHRDVGPREARACAFRSNVLRENLYRRDALLVPRHEIWADWAVDRIRTGQLLDMLHTHKQLVG